MKKKYKKLFYFVAGEPSGDLHGSQLIQNIKVRVPNIRLSGIGGVHMKKEGLSSLVPMKKMSIMGFSEIIKQLKFFLDLEKLIVRFIKQTKPDKIILIDYPGFNLRLAKKLKKQMDTPIIYYISPQVWAWKEGRVRIIKKYIDCIIGIFPFEVDWYKKMGVDIRFFGHPIRSLNIKNNLNLINNSRTKIALCPGSRIQEIIKHLPVLIKVVNNLKSFRNKTIEYSLILAPGVSEKNLTLLLKNENINIIKASVYNSVSDFDLAIVASGTATLECAAVGTPFVVIYKMSWFSWFITKLVVSEKFASIVNIIANKPVVCELLQNNCSSTKIIHAIHQLEDIKKYNQLRVDLKKLVSTLGSKNAYIETSNFILNF